VAAFFSFGGWWDANKLAGEVRDPGRTLPRALTLGVVVVTALYILVSLVFLYLVPTSRITSDRAFAALAGEALFGRAGAVVFAGVVALAVLGSLAAILMASPRVYYAMARDGLFPPALAALQAVLASALVLTGKFDEILAYFFFVTVAFLALTVAGVYAPALRPGPGNPEAVRVPGYPVTPLLFLVPIVLLLVMLAAGNPWRSLLGLGVVAIGLPVYHLVSARGVIAKPRTDPPTP
jgi:APA family basic amino acid/polyamine antiporter